MAHRVELSFSLSCHCTSNRPEIWGNLNQYLSVVTNCVSSLLFSYWFFLVMDFILIYGFCFNLLLRRLLGEFTSLVLMALHLMHLDIISGQEVSHHLINKRSDRPSGRLFCARWDLVF